MALFGRIADALGRDSRAIRTLQPVREWLLSAAYGRKGLVCVVNGVPLRVTPCHRALFPAEHDPHVVRYLRDRITPAAVCFNVGANLGVYALQFAHWSGPTGPVVAFEPNPTTASVLQSHIQMNHLESRVRVCQVALADRPGMATFHAAGVDGMSRLGEPNPSLSGQTTGITVPVQTLDGFCQESSLSPDVLMIDVEGFEVQVLRGASELFRQKPPRATVVELHPNAWAVAGTNRSDLEQLLTEYGLRAVPLSGQTDPFAEYGHVALEPAAR